MPRAIAMAALTLCVGLCACGQPKPLQAARPKPANAAATISAPPFVMESIAFHQPPEVVKARAGADAEPMANYAKALKAAAAEVFAAAPLGPGVSGAIVVAVRPGGKSRTWLVLGEDRLAPALAGELRRKLEAVPPLSVTGGPVSFALNFSAWGGGKGLDLPREYPVAVPQEWAVAVSEGGSYPDDALPQAWPE